jgi:S-adenosylmethionine:tRNA ribosyltransferase-isomerase
MNRLSVDPALRVDDFDFDLPPTLIAQAPIEPRDASRMLVVDRSTSSFSDERIRDLPNFLRSGDLLVRNVSQVIPARFWARRKATGGKIELLLLRSLDGARWEALAKPAKRLTSGMRAEIVRGPNGESTGSELVVVERGEQGLVILEFLDDAFTHLHEFGVAPLPPYIHERLEDAQRYQTLYATNPGSAAAPTAGLHFTPDLMAGCESAGARWADVTLHIGLDTFRPVSVDRVADHQIHTEWCSVSDDSAALIAETKRAGNRVIAIGTTSARTLETLGQRVDLEHPRGFSAPTNIFITPGYRWTVVDAMLTNFHLPRSTLIMMISALIGRDTLMRAYAHAVEEQYRFFSFGDAMLIV